MNTQIKMVLNKNHKRLGPSSRYMASLLIAGACTLLPMSSNAAGNVEGSNMAMSAVELTQAWPEQVGVDSSKLVQLSEWIRAENLDIRSLLVIKDDKLVFERYSSELTRDHNYELYSITKSVTSLLAGMLIAEGKLSLDDSISSVIGNFRPDLKDSVADKKEVKLRHLLSMSSGLHYDFNPENDPIYYGSPDRLKLVSTTTPKIAPGSEFEYTDVNPVFVAAMVSAAAGMPIEQYAEQKLFKPLGMKNYEWDRADDQGLVSAGWGLRLRPVDMAKLGLLIKDSGLWNGVRVVPKGWVEQMSTPVAARDFGYFLWRNHIVDTELSLDMMGFKGQFISVLPDRNTVVVMTSMLPIDGGLRHGKNVRIFRNIVNDYVIPATQANPALTMSDATKKVLTRELKISGLSVGVPGVFVDPTDTPRK
ncbi:MAG: serine hydrolase [Motiliproteus sp.]